MDKAAHDVKEKVDELARLTAVQEQTKAAIDSLKAWFEIRATDDLKDTKKKTAEYWGSGNARVTVGNSATVKPVSMTMVKKMMGGAFSDFVKEETTYKMTEPCKRLLSVMFLGNYTEGNLDSTIKAITMDDKIQRMLRKKLKGKYEKDTLTLMNAAGLPEEEASDWAYLTAEIINWEWIVQVLSIAEWNGTPQEAIDIIRSAVIVDEGMKVTLEVKEDK
jgi:hypothetical protein